MKHNKTSYIIVLIALCYLPACSTKSNHSAHDTTIVHYTVTKGKPLPPKEWHCYNIDSDKICIPSKWNFINQNKFFLMSNLNGIEPNSYYVVVKYDEKKTGFNPTKYLKETYLELKKDTMGQFTGCKVFKIIYDNKESFVSEFYTSINKKPYVTYSTVFEIDNNLYDFALKIDKDSAGSYQETIKNIIFNFYHKNELAFSINDKIKGVEIVNLDKL